MAAKGNAAKEHLTKVIVDALGEDFICVESKKIYAWADDGGDRVQIAISMTMPKTQVSAAPADNDWREETPKKVSTELSEEDRAKIDDLKRRLGIVD